MPAPFVGRRLPQNTLDFSNFKIILGFTIGVLFGTNFCALFSYDDDVRHDAALSQALKEKEESLPKGWKSIDIFYGHTKHLTDKIKPPNQEWQGQVMQDKLVVNLLEGKMENEEGGYFVDLAANDAWEWSNTYALEKHGWDGLCIEPNPVYWFGLSFRKCQVAAALVGGESGKDELTEIEASFRGVFGGIVGLYDENLANRKREPKANKEKRFLVPFNDILKKYNAPKIIDYLSLDVEGAEYLVMKDFPFDTHRISLMTVERPNDQLKKLFEENGYIFLKQLVWWGETLWAHKSLGYTPDHPKIVAIVEEKQN